MKKSIFLFFTSVALLTLLFSLAAESEEASPEKLEIKSLAVEQEGKWLIFNIEFSGAPGGIEKTMVLINASILRDGTLYNRGMYAIKPAVKDEEVRKTLEQFDEGVYVFKTNSIAGLDLSPEDGDEAVFEVILIDEARRVSNKADCKIVIRKELSI